MLQAVPGLSFSHPTFAGKGPPVASTPTPGAPTDGPALDDFKPAITSYASLAAYPLVGGGVGAFAGLSQTAAIIAGVVTGGTVGLMAGAGIGMLIDLIKWGSHSNATGKCAFIGALVGGVAGGIGASMLPVAVTAGCLGVGGVVLGLGIAKVASKGIKERARRKVDHTMRSGSVHISRVFRQIYDRDGNGAPGPERAVRACEKLETAGWRFGVESDELKAHVTHAGHTSAVSVHTPDGAQESLPLTALPVLAYLQGSGSAADVDDVALVDSVKRFASQGRSLTADSYRSTSTTTPDGVMVRQAEVCDALAGGQRVVCVHDDVAMRVEARDAASLDAAMKTVDELAGQYDQHLAPAFKSGVLDPTQKTQVFESLLKSPYGTDLGRSAPLLIKLAAVDTSDGAYRRTYQATSTLDTLSRGPADRVTLEQAVDDYVELSARMPGDRVLDAISQLRDSLSTVEVAKSPRYHDCFMRVLRSTGDRPGVAARAVQILAGADGNDAEAQVSALEKLSAASSAQKDYVDIMLDHATLMAGRSPGESLDTAASRYARLLEGFSAVGKADEAAPTYAFIKAALRDGRAFSTDEDALVSRAVEAARQGDGDAARTTLLAAGANDARGDVEAIEKRLQGALDPGTARRTARLLGTLPPAYVDKHMAVIEALARAAAYQKGYTDLLLDYATLMAVRDAQVPLEQTVSEYSNLLSGLASMSKADEAAPTYAFMRSGIAHGRFGSATVEQLTEKFFTATLAGADVRRARQSLLQVTPGTNNTVTKDDKVVIIGGVAVPINR